MRSRLASNDRAEGGTMNDAKLPPPLPNPPPTPIWEYEFHELADEYPLIEGEEFENLVVDIRKLGILEPIVLYQGKILDGRNRYRAAKEASYKFTERDFRNLALSIDPEEFVSSKNDHRRNLDSKQKRALIARKIGRHPNYSNRQIARLTCCDHKTVASVRDEMRKRVDTFKLSWGELTSSQRREFVASVREEMVDALGISPAQK
jgi:hypothetical protein